MNQSERDAIKWRWAEGGDYPEPEGLLDADQCWAIGLDPTGRDGDVRYPFTTFDLTPEELTLLEKFEALSPAQQARASALGPPFMD